MIHMAQSLVSIDERVAHVKWAANLDGTVKAYNVYVQINSGKVELVDTTTENEWFSPPLSMDCEYTFYVTSINTGDIESDLVNPIKFTLTGAKPEPYFEPRIEEVTIATGTSHTIDLLPYGKDVMIIFEVDL